MENSKFVHSPFIKVVTNGGKWCILQARKVAYYIRKGDPRLLIGTYEHAFDAKGRVFIPSRWREAAGDTVVVMEGILGTGWGRCLFGMSVAQWEVFSARLSELPMTDLAAQAVKRRLYASAAACEVDKQGRILIPANLRTRAGIGKEATLLGVGNRIEIWATEELSAHQKKTGVDYDEALMHLAGMGI